MSEVHRRETLVSACAKGEFTSRFPFSVGIEQRSYTHYLLALGALLIGYGFDCHADRLRGRLGAGALGHPRPLPADPG